MLRTRGFEQLSKPITQRSRKLGLGFGWRRWISICDSGEEVQQPRRSKRVAALWGNGDYGRLGLGTLESQWKPVCCSAFGDQSIGQIACGGAHTLFLTESGSVYATGLNDFGQLGISDDRSYTTEPLEVSGLPKEIVKVSAGYSHSSAITVDGDLYMWGKNSSGQLGLGKRAAKIVSIPKKVECLDGVQIQMAALGCDHSIAVTDKGEALSWGGGGSGRLGHGHESSTLGFLMSSSEYTPRLIKKLEGVKVKSAAAGMLHSACVDENGSMFIFGERSVKKLGFGESKVATTPSMINIVPCSDEVACGGYHTCVITSGGELFTWGSNENGCLGIGCIDVAHLPERVQGPFLKLPVNKVSCGWKHTAAISGCNVYTWGWGGSYGTFSIDGHSSAGQLVCSRVKLGSGQELSDSSKSYLEQKIYVLGFGDDVDYIEPMMVSFDKNVKALQVSCGFNHTAAILEYI